MDGVGARPREAVRAVDDDTRDLLLGFFHKGKHAVKLLPLVGLGALVGAPEVLYHLQPVLEGEGVAVLPLGGKALVVVGLLLGGYAGVDHHLVAVPAALALPSFGKGLK
ncbi:hypothetical protein TH61_05590 [Rufibacter sp. DG15C]|nr:hypothetical protein TH61_05590 [Rufibacter sp. DG15C]